MDMTLPQEWSALCLLVFVLGLKHGFDADHLATIDGLTRFNIHRYPRLARYCGTLFSLGHGGVVLLVALAVSALSRAWATPAWLEGLGSAISILFLSVLGILNLMAVLGTAPHEVVRPVGLKGRWLGGLARAAHPGWAALVGALFALSFDTLSQAALFALTAVHFGGWHEALMLGGLFVLGMLITDGLNGFWIARLIGRADRMARIASRVMGTAVSIVSLGVAGLGVARWLSPLVDGWSEGKELAFGMTVMLSILIGFFLAAGLARRQQPAIG